MIKFNNKEAYLDFFIEYALMEDTGDGDHTSLACVGPDEISTAVLLVKDEGILAGVELMEIILKKVDPDAKVQIFKSDGSYVTHGDIAFQIQCKSRALLLAERLILNTMQRMSGVATLSRQYADAVQGYDVKILDTRKTMPLNRFLQKWAVEIGGCMNYRFGLFDRIMIKDNHVDAAGGMEAAIERVITYLDQVNKDLPITVEVRDFEELNKVMQYDRVDRVMLDNFSIADTKEAVDHIQGKKEVEASGGITLDTLARVAATGVDFISVGALTHSAKSLDLSLKVRK